MIKGIPKCFDSRRQYRVWMAAAGKYSPGKSDYCTDCTPTYQQKMIESNRCGHPQTTFHLDRDGMTEGRRPIKDRVSSRKNDAKRKQAS